MTYPQVWGNAVERALPVGRLDDRTLLNILTARRVFFRTGPWVPLLPDDSRLLQVLSPLHPQQFTSSPGIHEPEPELLFSTAPAAPPGHEQDLGTG